jgi:tetratricopeptide (TPR) repeat protein
MGLVFVAEQQHPVRRKVALKVIKPGMDTRQVVARFEAERQALALMDHPNIAQVHDGGTTDSGRPYFVMELVKGVPITAFCDQNQVGVRARLELFMHVCQAVQHAHQKGIIHRDLKPSNVLVLSQDGTPVVKVIDFGVAKAIGQQLTEKTIYTHFAQLVGTPLYMSPEQAGKSGLDVDTRSDIYSLGVLLYELLTGTTPFDPERLKTVGFDEICRILREEEPPKPSTRLSTLGQAATTISTQRKSDPRRLSQLFRGELDWMVMKALDKDRNRRYESASALASDAQRYLHDEPVQACPPSAGYRLRKFVRRNRVGLALAGLILLIVMLLGGSVGWGVRDRALRHERAVQEAKAALRDVAQLREQRKWADALALTRRVKRLLDTEGAASEMRRQFFELDRDLEMVSRLERISLDMSNAKGDQGDPWGRVQADASYAAAFHDYGIDLTVVTPEEAADIVRARDVRVELAAALDSWAILRREQRSKGDRSWLDLLRTARLADPDRWRNQLRSALERADLAALRTLTDSKEVATLPPVTQGLLGVVLLNIGAVEQSLAVLRLSQQQHPSDFWLNHNLGLVLRKQTPPQLDDAIRYLTAAVALASESPGAHVALGLALHEKKALDEAICQFEAALALDRNDFAAHNNLGTVLFDKKDWEGAIRHFEAALLLDPKSALVHRNLGNALHARGNRDAALREFQAALQLDTDYRDAHYSLGIFLFDQGDREGAIREYRAALTIDPNFAPAHNNWGTVLRAQGDLDGATRQIQLAIRLDPRLAMAHFNLGNTLLKKGNLKGAIRSYEAAVQIDSGFRDARLNLGNVLYEMEELEAAIREYQTVVQIDPQYAQGHYCLANALEKKGDLESAIGCHQTALRINPKYAEAHCNLGLAYWKQGRFADAVTALKTGHEIGSQRAGWSYPSATWIQGAQRLVLLDARLEKVLAGRVQPADAAECVALAELCGHQHRQLHAAAARFYADAFNADSKLADNLRGWDRYKAACAAALASSGKGRDAATLGEADRALLRRQALNWLRSQLAALRTKVEMKDAPAAPVIRKMLEYWLADPRLAGVRLSKALAPLPREERQQWQDFWAEVEQLLVKYGG